MLIRKFALFWILVVALTSTLHFLGSVNGNVLVAVGMLTALLVFIGMMVMVPLSVIKGPSPRFLNLRPNYALVNTRASPSPR